MKILLIFIIFLSACTEIISCDPVQIDQAVFYFRGVLLAKPEINVNKPYCVYLGEESLSSGVVRKDFKCVVCLENY